MEDCDILPAQGRGELVDTRLPRTGNPQASCHLLHHQGRHNAIYEQLVDSLGQDNGAVFKMYGGMSQSERKQALDGFQGHTGLILVATRLAALGLNLPRLSQILNIRVPLNITSYIQACGRAARSGREVATIRTAILERDMSVFTQYQR